MFARQLRSDRRGVSPVIAVILMVAITVILAAIVGFFVIDTGGDQQTTPQAKFEFDSNATAVTVTHNGGQEFDTKNTFELKVMNEDTGNTDPFDVSNGVTSGDTASVAAGPGDSIQVIWTSPEAKKSHILSSWTVP